MQPAFSVFLFLVYQISYCQDTTGVGRIHAKMSAIENTPRQAYLMEIEKDTSSKIGHIWNFIVDTTRQELLKVEERWSSMRFRHGDSAVLSRDTVREEYYFDRNRLIAVKQSFNVVKARRRTSYGVIYFFKGDEAFAAELSGSYGRQNARLEFLDPKKETTRRYLECAWGFLKKYSLHSLIN